MKLHKIALTAGPRPGTAAMRCGDVELGVSRQPLYDAARALLAAGLADPEDRIETWRGENRSMCTYSTVREAAKWTVIENSAGGLRRTLWQPFGYMGSRDTHDAGN